MSERLVECVPNFSEGRNLNIINQITAVIEAVEGVKLLNVDPGADMNRTVVTFIGAPEKVKIAAFESIKKASELIDMTKHKGSHPRMGATDVCPFIPVSGVTNEEVIKLSEELAEEVASKLRIPVYLYEQSARSPKRENLAIIRQGEYEGLEEKLKNPEWKPDFGDAIFNPKSGATVIGVREFLIAYNINLNTREVRYATDIAFELREKGRSARNGSNSKIYLKRPNILKYSEGNYPTGLDDFCGKTIEETANYCKEKFGFDLIELLELNGVNPQKPEGESVKIPGKFKHCKAIGWMVPEFDRAQISINLTNYKVTSMHHVLEETRKLAAERGIVVTGSEIVGMVPFNALYETGKYYLSLQGRSTGIPVMDVLNTALQSLGLTDVSKFDIESRVLGLPKYDTKALVSMTVSNFTDEVSRESPAPGGGSISALAGSLGAALTSMVANLTAYKKSESEIDCILESAAVTAQLIKDKLMRAVDEDTNAFNDYMDAMRLPQRTAEEKESRTTKMQEGLKKAIAVPLNTAKLCLNAMENAQVVLVHGNPNSITDTGVGVQMAYAGLKGAIYNVLINLKDIKDKEYIHNIKEACESLEQTAAGLAQNSEKFVKDALYKKIL